MLASFHHYSHHMHLAVFFSHLILFIRTKLNCKVITVYIGYVKLDRTIPSRSTPEWFNMVQFDTSSSTWFISIWQTFTPTWKSLRFEDILCSGCAGNIPEVLRFLWLGGKGSCLSLACGNSCGFREC